MKSLIVLWKTTLSKLIFDKFHILKLVKIINFLFHRSAKKGDYAEKGWPNNSASDFGPEMIGMMKDYFK